MGRLLRLEEEHELNLLTEAEQARLGVTGAQAHGAYIVAEDKISAGRNVYRGWYQEYINLNTLETPTVDRLFSIREFTEVEEVPPDRWRVRDALVLGGGGGLVLAWLLAAVIDFVRRRRGIQTVDSSPEPSDDTAGS
jgi:hypothetical protein